MSKTTDPIKKISTKIFELGIKKRDMEIESNKARIKDEEQKEKAKELSASITEMSKRLLVNDPDYKEVEKLHLIELDEYIEKSVSYKEKNSLEEEKNVILSKQNSFLAGEIEKNSKVADLCFETIIKTEGEMSEKADELKFLSVELQAKKDEKRKELTNLQQQVEKERTALSSLQSRIAIDTKEIRREQRILSIQKTDLDIYLSRMKKKYPTEKFILIEE